MYPQPTVEYGTIQGTLEIGDASAYVHIDVDLVSRRQAAGHGEFTPVKHRRSAKRTQYDRPAIQCGKRCHNLAGILVH